MATLPHLRAKESAGSLAPRKPEETVIALATVPFWAPLSPPLGCAVLKSHLGQHGYRSTIKDFNADQQLWGAAADYFKVLRDVIPPDMVGNFHMMAFDAMTMHLMAWWRRRDPTEYHEFVKVIYQRKFFVQISDEQIETLDRILDRFFATLASRLDALLEEVRPSIVGLTVYSTSLAPSLFAFEYIRKRHPEITTLMGGGVFADYLHPTSPNFAYFLEQTAGFVDRIFVGEGEILLSRFLKGELPDQRVYSNSSVTQLDMSAVDPPDFAGLDLDAYVQMAAYATRSCPFQCSFCSETVQWGRFRAKDPRQICSELKQLRHRYGRSLFQFGDSLLNQVIDGLARELIDHSGNVYYDAYLRADPEACVPENASLWARSGYYRARLGIESGSKHVLDLMQKEIGPQQAGEALRCLAQAGIKTTTYWVVGHPGETDGDFEETLSFVSEHATSIYEADWHPFYYYPQGQVFSKKWSLRHGIDPQYPEEFRHLFLGQMWVLRTSPTPAEVFDRMNRFRERCRKMGIPNPYTLVDIHRADLRWQKLHANAPPPIAYLMSGRAAPPPAS